jgi:LuxR family maltose regulon positive regulatory protein
LQKVQTEVGESALSMLRSPQPAPIELILTTLINETRAYEDGFDLIPDDYHIIDARPIHSAITFLLDYLPPHTRLIIAGRFDPPLPLSRLRGGGELTENLISDLRFTPDEAAVFLNEVMNLGLSADDVASQETRTEGCIAGLQLAALSMQGRDDVAAFISAFAGDDRYVVDYLVEEVRQRQPEWVRNYLLQTSILDRLSGPLCDVVTSGEDSPPRTATLAALGRGNLFVVPLDVKRQWYRYHHLFADVLQAHSMEEQPDRAPILHRRASKWHEENGAPADAVRHALAAEDFERAAGLIELAWPAINRGYEDATWLGWVKSLPDEIVRVRPVLSVGYASDQRQTGAVSPDH